MSKKSKIYVKDGEVIIEKEGKITRKDVEDYILELNENTEKLRAIILKNRIIEAITGLLILFLGLFISIILYAVQGGATPTTFWFLSANPTLVTLIMALIAFALVLHAFLRTSPQLE